MCTCSAASGQRSEAAPLRRDFQLVPRIRNCVPLLPAPPIIACLFSRDRHVIKANRARIDCTEANSLNTQQPTAPRGLPHPPPVPLSGAARLEPCRAQLGGGGVGRWGGKADLVFLSPCLILLLSAACVLGRAASFLGFLEEDGPLSPLPSNP